MRINDSVRNLCDAFVFCGNGGVAEFSFGGGVIIF